jgi:hypothetical protein
MAMLVKFLAVVTSITTTTTVMTHLQLATKTDLDRRLAGNLRRWYVVTRARVIVLQPKTLTAVVIDHLNATWHANRAISLHHFSHMLLHC